MDKLQTQVSDKLSELSGCLAMVGMHLRVLIMNENRTEHCLGAAMILLALAQILAEDDYTSKGDESSDMTLQHLMALNGLSDDFQVVMSSRTDGEIIDPPNSASVADDSRAISGGAQQQQVSIQSEGGIVQSKGDVKLVSDAPITLSDANPGIALQEFELAVGEVMDIAGNIANPHQQQVSIKSDDDAVLTVDGTTLTAVAPGDANITVALYKKGEHSNITTTLPAEVHASDDTEEK